jgi:YD repeat-containing protein
VQTLYDAATGRVTTTQTLNGTSVVQTISIGYDQLGRQTSYTDAAGVMSSTSYDALNRPVSVNDAKQATTYAYETAGERRGMPTSLTTNGLTWSGVYNPDGALYDETLPNQLHQCATLDATGDVTAQTYAKGSCLGTIWLTETQVSNGSGQWIHRDATLGPAGWSGQQRSIQDYTYDPAGRLSTVNDTYGAGPNPAANCTIRAYAYDQDTNRTGYWTQTAATCPSAPGTLPVTHTYDSADRITDAGYTYDPYGRITIVPNPDTGLGSGSALAATYYTNDLVASVSRTGTGAAVPCQEIGRVSGSGKVGIVGLARPWWTSWGRFQASASCGRIVLNSVRNASA